MKKMKKLIDQYITSKFSGRLFYGHGRKYKNTKFQPGSKYVVDVQENKMIILPSTEGKKVSKRRLGEKEIVPVIDVKTLKNKEQLDTLKRSFKGATQLQISIYEDEIVVEAYEETSDSSRENRALAGVSDITELFKVRKKAKAILPKVELAKVVGAYQDFKQISLFDVVQEDVIQTSTKESVISLDTALKNIKIPLQVASLFSGAGCGDFGLQKSGFTIEYALELNEDAALTHAHNFNAEVDVKDICEIDKSTLPKVPVYWVTPPCKGFSKANRINNGDDNPNSKLMLQAIEAIKANEECKVFVIENVPDILNSGYHHDILEQLNEFDISYGVLNALDYEGYQERKRAFYIGSKIDKIPLPKPVKKVVKTVRDAFKGLHNKIANQLDFTTPKPETQARMKFVPPGGNWRNIPENLRQKCQHSNVYRRLEWDKPSITIPNPRKSNILHPSEHRTLSIRECARLLGLPDSFEFVTRKNKKGEYSISAMQEMIGNAVCVDMAYHIGLAIKKAIMKFNIRGAHKQKDNKLSVGYGGQLAFF